ncbi:MAG TPA: 5-oxoprolinase subunit PxpA [Candidatus Dormibacteraeota bacterium]|nr:5-oxoprolinase subunit PxpA [Candidatus Dormibacteraeota bacterium]
MAVIDLNADLGESFGSFVVGHDTELIPLLTSANVACGFHAGDPRVMDRTVAACRAAGVAVGAHPSFPDLVGFGRRGLRVSGREAETDVLYQVAALDGFCRRHGTRLQHVKPHGAMYNAANRDASLAAGVAAGIAAYDPELVLVCQFGTELARAGAAAGLTVACEGFVDRAYNPDGSLVSREIEGSVYHDQDRATEQALRMVTEGTVVALDGTVVDVRVDTLCAHGDNPEAVAFLGALRSALGAAGVEVRSLRDVLSRRQAVS